MRRLAALALAIAPIGAMACASAGGGPPGGPADHTAPRITAISPDSGGLNVRIRSAEFKFDEVVSDQPPGSATSLDRIFLISPRDGAPRVSWHRSRITVRPRNGFRPNTAYRITVLPGLSDLRGNVRTTTSSILFSTGATIPSLSIVGRVFDWAAKRPAPGAYVEAISARDTNLVYVAAADSAGHFDAGPLDSGTYLVRAVIDRNANRAVDRNEQWDTLTVTVSTSRPAVELDAIERDSTPPAIENIRVLDSVTVRITFDKPIAPSLELRPSLVRLQRADSSALQVAGLQWQSAFDRERQVRDSVRRADSTRAETRADSARADSARARGDTAALRRRPAPARAGTAPARGAREAPPPPTPSTPPPDRGIVVTVSPSTPFVPGTSYRITTRNIPNLVGHTREDSRPFELPAMPVVRPPRDTTGRRPPAGDARRPPGTGLPARPGR